MITLTEDEVLERLSGQDQLKPFLEVANDILLSGIRDFLPSVFISNDEDIREYAVKPLLAKSGPLDNIYVSLRLIYALGKLEKWAYADIICFYQFGEFQNENETVIEFYDDITYDFICNLNAIVNNEQLFQSIKNMKFSDFNVFSKERYGNMVKTGLTLAVTSLLQEFAHESGA